jgi:hypothetical protein
MLRAFILAAGYQTGGEMRDADRRIRRVDMLPALAARTVGVGTNIFRLDDDLNAVVDFRRNKNAGKRRVPPLGLIER